jgi:Nif-specific regulatory protein
VPQLTVLNGSNYGRTIILAAHQVCRLGRDPALDLCLDDAKASRVHVEIECKDGQWVLRDLQSRNGTLVNGTRVSTAVLKDSDQLQVGETRVAFTLKESTRASSPPDDSMLAPRIPVGAVPALGTAGMTARGDAEGFETLELDAPLKSLQLDGAGVPVKSGLLPGRPAEGGDTPDSLERSNRGLRGLYSIARACAEAASTSRLLSVLAVRLRAALDADRVTPLLLEEGGRWQVAELDPASGEPEPGRRTPAFSRVPVSRTIVDYALRTGRAVLTAPRSDARFAGARSVGEQGITSAMCAPIAAGGRCLGLVYADRLGGQDFDRADQELLTAACLQAAPALAGLQRLETALARKDRLLAELRSQHDMVGECPAMKEVYAFIERAAPTPSAVLVLGESGTGKELVAHAIHYNSARRDAPLVIVNCAALSESLIESELFGHARGSFTGATADRVGRFELAHEGTIFLDEIGELSNACQTKLLRVLEQGELSRVGEARVRKVDVRLIAATNRDVEAEVAAGRFRQDLYYRLNVLTVRLPALRERGADLRKLAEHFLRLAAERSGRRGMSYSEEAWAFLAQYRWPGNVRELRNLAERLAVLCPQEVIGARDLPPEMRGGAAGKVGTDIILDGQNAICPPFPEGGAPPAGGGLKTLEELEREHILRVLQTSAGNKKQAAEILGIDRSTLYAKLRAYGILPA